MPAKNLHKRVLPVDLTPDRRAVLEADIVAKASAAVRWEEEIAVRRGLVKEAGAEVVKAVAVIDAGTEEAEVPCHDFYDYEKRLVSTIRLDSGAVLYTREMTAEETQTNFLDTMEHASEDAPLSGEDAAAAVARPRRRRRAADAEELEEAPAS